MDSVLKCTLCLQHVTLGDIHNDFILKGHHEDAELRYTD